MVEHARVMSRTPEPRPNRRRSVARAARASESARALPSKPSLRVRVIAFRMRAAQRIARYATPLTHAGRVIVLAAVAAGAVAAGRLVEQHVRRAQAFATTAIEIEGAQKLSREKVLAAAGLALGRNVFDVSPEQAQERLRAHPFVAEATVTRRLPSSYRIVLREQEVAAVLAIGERLLLVGQDGSVLKPLEPGDPVDVPVISGADEALFDGQVLYRTAILQSAVALLADYREAGLWGAEPIAEIHVEPDQGLSLFVGGDATSVHLGKPPYAKKLRRLRGIFERLVKQDARPLYVYLDNERRPDRVTVRLR
jgi:cell division protein FtsQ